MTTEKDKSLKNKAVDIKGKKYVQVADRIIYFSENYPDGYIVPELLSELSSPQIFMRATVIPDKNAPERKFIAHSQETVGEGFINKTSALENAETSAVGRALAMMGIGVIESIASSDEINKANNASTPQNSYQNAPGATKTVKATIDPQDYECEACGAVAKRKSGEKNGKPWAGIFCTDQNCKVIKWENLSKPTPKNPKPLPKAPTDDYPIDEITF